MEVYRSYQKALENAGFDILFNPDRSKANVPLMVRTLYSRDNNNMAGRPYVLDGRKTAGSDWLSTFAAYYASARKQVEDKMIYVAVKEYGIDASRLAGHGVGPLSPVATNKTETGRKLNRRVELVLRLKANAGLHPCMSAFKQALEV